MVKPRYNHCAFAARGTLPEYVARPGNVIEREGWWLRNDAGRRPSYFAANGRRLTSAAALERIEALRVPPAWRDVHISPDSTRKIQAWGFDSKGRKQYIYSSEHVERRDLSKWSRVLRVAAVLPELRAVTNQHLRRRELDSRKVHATVVRLICRAYFRAGSERYAVTNKTFGLTTLCKQHVRIVGSSLIFEYRGKRSISHRQVVADTPLVQIIEELLELPGDRLFQLVSGHGRKAVSATS